MEPPRNQTLRRLLFCAALLGAGACVYDASEKCSTNQRYWNETCICVEGAVQLPNGCVPCGENETPVGNECACVAGYERLEAGAKCTPRASQLGVACDTASTPCSDPNFSECHVVSGTSGYCTSTGCSAEKPCTGDYACDTNASVPYCRRPPVGAGKACAAPADCASTEATYCESFSTKQCFVQGCTQSPNSCFPGMECCLISLLGKTLCLPPGGCAKAGGTQ
ncbi:MAG: hypothetical protein SFV15_07350 [Polyangiaceae bacterium]|nr:hypothetical protein [Polyangiaceae bacterium]